MPGQSIIALKFLEMTRRTPTGHRSMTSLVLVAVIMLSSGVLAGLAIARSSTPTSLRPAPGAGTLAVVVEPFPDARSVELSLARTAGIDLTSHRPGVVTSSECRVRAVVRSGTSPWSVAGRRLLALATATPLYRDLDAGVRGEDVQGLQRELTNLSLPVPVTGILDSSTAVAIAVLRQRAGMSASRDLPLADTVWLPSARTSLSRCQALPGVEIAQSGPLATTAAVTASARINPMPDGLVPGARVLTVGGRTVVVGVAGDISDPKTLNVVLATTPGQVAEQTADSDHPVPLPASLALATPVDAATVPASAVRTVAGPCVFDEGGAPHRVNVVASALGRSVVVFAGSDVPRRVAIHPAEAASCK